MNFHEIANCSGSTPTFPVVASILMRPNNFSPLV